MINIQYLHINLEIVKIRIQRMKRIKGSSSLSLNILAQFQNAVRNSEKKSENKLFSENTRDIHLERQ